MLKNHVKINGHFNTVIFLILKSIIAFQWFEVNCTVQEYGSVPIWEPCNYASNIAYYHTVTEICFRKEWSMPEESGNFHGSASSGKKGIIKVTSNYIKIKFIV